MNVHKKYTTVSQIFFLVTISVFGRLFAGSTIINGSLLVNGLSTFNGSFDSNATSSFTGALILTGTTHVAGPVVLTNSETHNGAVTFGDSVTHNGTENHNGTINLNGTTKITGGTTLLGSTTLTNTTKLAGPVTFTGSETHNGTETHNGSITLAGPVTLSNTANLNGQINANNNIFVQTGSAVFTDHLGSISGAGINVTDYIIMQSGKGIQVDFIEAANGSLELTGSPSVDGSLTVFGSTYLSDVFVTGTIHGSFETTNFSGSLAGDVSGTQHATVVNTVGGATAADIATAASAVSQATDSDVSGALVQRDVNGSFAVNNLAATSITSNTMTVGTITLNELDLLTSTTLFVNGNLSLAPNATFFVDNIAGESGSLVENIGVTNLVVVNTSSPSDQRLKKDITDLDSELCLALVNQLVPHEFNYRHEVKKALGDDGKRHIGFIAQELAKIDPRFVNIVTGKKTLGDLTVEELAFVKQELFVPLLVGALKAEDKKMASKAERAEIQELQARLEALEKVIACINK